jgi:hypothetical protein
VRRYQLAILIASLLCAFILGCNNESEAQNGQENDAQMVEESNAFLQDRLDTENLWLSSRELSDVLVANPDTYADTPGAYAFYRFAYAAQIERAVNAFDNTVPSGWPAPEQLLDDPIAAVSALEDIYARTGVMEILPEALWMKLSSLYRELTNENLGDINSRMAMADDGPIQYSLDAAGFFSEVDHQAAICGYITAQKLADISMIDVKEILMARFENWWSEIPKDADGNADLIGLIETYDIVTYPYALDIFYRDSGDKAVYWAMEEILTAYAGALTVEGLYDRVSMLPDKENALEQLCVLSRLFRRMYAFVDEEVFIEASEGIMAEIGPLCLAGPDKLVVNYVYSLLLIEEPALHVIIIGPSDVPTWDEFSEISRDRYEPRLALMPLDTDNDTDLIERIEYPPMKKTSCFVCIDANCYSPVTTVEKLWETYDKAYEDLVENREKKMKKLTEDTE